MAPEAVNLNHIPDMLLMSPMFSSLKWCPAHTCVIVKGAATALCCSVPFIMAGCHFRVLTHTGHSQILELFRNLTFCWKTDETEGHKSLWGLCSSNVSVTGLLSCYAQNTVGNLGCCVISFPACEIASSMFLWLPEHPGLDFRSLVTSTPCNQNETWDCTICCFLTQI